MAKTILVVDDIAFVRKTLTEILTEAHYEVIGQAADGREAINLYTKLKPDLVTLDLVMPKMSGIEAARQITKMDPSSRIIMITAMAHENLIMEAINSGARDYVLKPFTTPDILKALDRAFKDYTGNSRSRTA
jgi:two-component system chemotaxis response regulator CheY